MTDAAPHKCQARQQGDSMYCARCRLTWDVGDPEPPRCLERPAAPLVVKVKKGKRK